MFRIRDFFWQKSHSAKAENATIFDLKSLLNKKNKT